MGGVTDRCARVVAAPVAATFLVGLALVGFGCRGGAQVDDLIRNTVRLGDDAPVELLQRNSDQYPVMLEELNLSTSYAVQPRTRDPILNALQDTACVSGDIASELPEGFVVSGLASVDTATGEVLGLVEVRPEYMPTSLPEGYAYFTIESDQLSDAGQTVSFFCQV